MLIDTHCHLDFEDFDADRDEVIQRAAEKGIGAIVNIGSSVDGTRRSVALADKYDIVYASIGVHPHDAGSVDEKVIAEFKALAKNKKVVAVGEVGLDYYRNLSPKDEQITAFKRFIHLARDLDLPLVIHSRSAEREALDILNRENRNGVAAVMHCFSGDADFLKRCLDAGLYVSFTCNLTFKNAAALREAAAGMPVERLLLETDAPFLAPQDFRGKRNEPSYLEYLVGAWSEILHLGADDIARITTHNANELFRLKLTEPSKIAYKIRDSLYLNITNSCTNNCDFCIRDKTPFVKGHNLKLDHEPSESEILDAAGDPTKYKEVVFCGYGEPTARLDALKRIASELKRKGASVRLVTNGHGNLINGRPIAKELAGIIDKVSVSLNTDNEKQYYAVCKPRFGTATYSRIVEFIKDCVGSGIKVEVTCLDLPGVNVRRCESIASSLGAQLRMRRLDIVG